MLKLLCSPTCNYIIKLTVSELFTLSNLFTNLAQDQILILILKCTCVLKKLTLQSSFPVHAYFLFTQQISPTTLSKYAAETEEDIDKNTYFFWYSIYLYTLIRNISQDMIQTQSAVGETRCRAATLLLPRPSLLFSL